MERITAITDVNPPALFVLVCVSKDGSTLHPVYDYFYDVLTANLTFAEAQAALVEVLAQGGVGDFQIWRDV